MVLSVSVPASRDSLSRKKRLPIPYVIIIASSFVLISGFMLKNTLIDYWRQVHKRYGYVEISTPVILNRQLWERSGHWDHYKNNMYTTVIDEEDFAVKPMNCPGGMLVYKNVRI